MPHMNLSGIGVDNGWIDAIVQGPIVVDFAWWHDLIDLHTKQVLHKEWNVCFEDRNVESNGMEGSKRVE